MSAKEVTAAVDFLKQKLMVVNSVAPNQKGKPEAQQALDEFKEKSQIATACGLKLAEKSQTSFFRSFGLELLQHAVKARWAEMSENEKQLLKINVMSLISNGVKHITLEKTDIKVGFARVVVEMIKHDWPDQWPKLLPELDAVAKKQEINAELVLLILWRLAEDVVTLQTEPVLRGQHLKRSLVENMKEILTIVLSLLEKNVLRYRVVKSDRTQQSQTQPSCTVATTAIYCLSGYISWMGIWHITQEDFKLLETIWVLLEEPDLQLPAAECLLVAVKRLEKVKYASLLPILFGDSAMNYILSAAKIPPGEELTEKHKNVLKKLCQVLCSMGSILCNILGSDTPATFGRYLGALLAFTERSTQFLHFSTQSTWSAIFKHEVLSRDPKLLAVLPNYLSAVLMNLEKVGVQSKNDSSGERPSLGLLTDSDFNATLKNSGEEQKEVIKLVCKVEPRVCFVMASWCLKCQMSVTSEPASAKSGILKFLSSRSPSSLQQWEAVTFFIEIVMSQIFKLLGKEALPVKEGIELIKLAMKFETTDPAILACVHANISVLLPFFHALNECSLENLSILFDTIEEIKVPKLQVLKDTKSCALACIIKLCQDNPTVILPHFQTLFDNVKRLLSNELLMTGMEKGLLTKCLVQLSNHFENYERQKAFLEELLTPVASLWLSEVMQWLLSDPETFIQYVGADLQTSDADTENSIALYRSRISYCVSSILEVLRWTQRPTNLNEAEAGGFVSGRMPNGDPIFCNPCSELVLTLLNNVFTLIRTLHIFYLPEVIEAVGGSFAQVLKRLKVASPQDSDPKKPLQDIYNPPVYETELQIMQDFYSTLYEECFTILGAAAQSLKQHFYNVDDLLGRLLNSAFINLEFIPTFRLKIILISFVKPLVLSCPPAQYQDLVCPILAPFLAAIHMRLTKEWSVIEQQKNKHDATSESQDDIEEEQVRLLTQELIRFIDSCSVTSKATDGSDNTVKSDGSADKNLVKDVRPPNAPALVLTELGTCLMKEPDIRSALLITAFTSLMWKDSLTCYRSATHLCWPLLQHVISEPLVPDAVTYFFTMVMKGLREHTDHAVYIDALVQLGFQIYESLRPRYEQLKEVLNRIPEIKDYFLSSYDKKVLGTAISPQDYILRKYHFKRLIQSFIGKPLTEEPGMGNIPPSAKKPKAFAPPSIMQIQTVPPGNPEAIPPLLREQEHFEAPFSNPEAFPPHFIAPNSFEPPFRNPEHVLPPFTQPNIFEPPPPRFNDMNRFRLPAANLEQIPIQIQAQMMLNTFLGNPPFFQPRFR
ncbi:exportin-5-like isoform X2 [Pleurodeles waltl]|uniref:exportin-5-like isoform X2 n=1 Tax=Pleurodeles waltl TaxID=8319 RepID=UPI003709C2D1